MENRSALNDHVHSCIVRFHVFYWKSSVQKKACTFQPGFHNKCRRLNLRYFEEKRAIKTECPTILVHLNIDIQVFRRKISTTANIKPRRGAKMPELISRNPQIVFCVVQIVTSPLIICLPRKFNIPTLSTNNQKDAPHI